MTEGEFLAYCERLLTEAENAASEAVHPARLHHELRPKAKVDAARDDLDAEAERIEAYEPLDTSDIVPAPTPPPAQLPVATQPQPRDEEWRVRESNPVSGGHEPPVESVSPPRQPTIAGKRTWKRAWLWRS